MSEKTKRKSKSSKDADAQGGVKKHKPDLSWLSDGLAGSEPFITLQRFIEEANSNLHDDADDEDKPLDPDIVQDFLSQGGTGMEFLSLLDSETKRKPGEIATIFTSLETIFSRMANDLSEYRNIGTKTASSILQSHMITIYKILAPSSSALQIKSALKLLTSMVTLGHLTAREVITRFDFTHACVTYILSHRSPSNQPDVRSTYLTFITSFLMEDDSMLLRTMGENPAILQPIFSGLIYDPLGVLSLFLTALRDKLVCSLNLGKTYKVRIFNTYTLNHLASLFGWLGPSHAPNIKDAETVSKEDNEEDRLAVCQLNQSLLLSLTTSIKLGIAFADYSLGTDRIQKNRRIQELFTAMGNYWEHQETFSPAIIELQSQIVFKTLHSCPDMIAPYFWNISTDLEEVRSSPAWLELCSLVRRILEGQNIELIFNPKEKHSLRQQSTRAASLICPKPLKKQWFTDCLASENMSIRLAVARILQTILKKIIEFHDILFNSPKSKSYNLLEKKSIYAQFKDLMRWTLPSSSIVVNSYPLLSNFKDELGDGLDSFSVFLDLLSLYPKIEFLTDDEGTIPGAQIVYDVVSFLQDSKADSDLLERLELSVFSFAYSVSDLGRVERRALIGQLIRCLVKTPNYELRSTAASLLFKTVGTGTTRLSFNVWLTVLERYPDCASAFSDLCVDLEPDKPLLSAAWNSPSVESMIPFISAVSCELLLCDGDVTTFSSIPKSHLSPSLKSFLKSWNSKSGSIPKDLGLNPLVRIILSKDSGNWNNQVLSKFEDRCDILEIVLHQTMTVLKRDPDSVEYLRDLMNISKNKDSFDRIFLQHPSSVEWFDPMCCSDPFISAFSALIRESLERVDDPDLNALFQRKSVSSICRMIRGEMTLHSPRDMKEPWRLFSELKMSDIEPLMTSMMDDSKASFFPEWLNLCLERSARLRLELGQGLSWSVFSRVLELFVKLKACPALHKGIYEVLSVYPEFLDELEQFAGVLNACLDSESDASRLVNLLTTSSAQLCAALGKSIGEREELFKDINWRVQTLPVYVSSVHDGNKVLAMLHRNMSPVLKKLLLSTTEFREAVLEKPELRSFVKSLVTRCWDPEECRDVAAQLISEAKNGLLCSQFADVGRRGTHYDLHLKLCLRTVVYQLKSEDVDPAELEMLVDELAWLSKQTKTDHSLAKVLIADSAWKKFTKYTLKTGLRALTEEDAVLPPLALRLMINTLSLLSAEEAATQQVYEMITGHSDFLPVIMDEEGIYVQQKQALLELLTVLVSLNPKLCQGSQVPLLLASYHATRSAPDQLILGLLKTYEKNNVLLSTYKPYLWGSAAAAHYSIQRGAPTRLSQQPEAGEVLALLDSEKLLNTAYRFPLRLRLNQAESVEEDSDYDPRFILSLLAHILSPEYVVQCERFTQSGATSLLFASLSSSCGEMRSLGWMALSRLFDQIQNSIKWPERCIWMHLIECLRLGTAEQHRGSPHPPKLSNLISLFIAKSAAIIRDPLHPMYKPINNFLMIKPVLDVTQVPEFFVLLHSTELPEQRSLHRTFLLNLLRDGLKNKRDYLVCARRRVFRILLTLLPSKLLVDQSDKIMILEVIQSALRIPIIAYDLIRNRGLLMWLDGLLLGGDKSVALQLLQVISTLWNTLEDHLQKKRSSLDKTDDEEAVAQLEKELDKMEEEEEEKKVPEVNTFCRKPVWNMLPTQEQVIAPWIVYELMQLMINLWGSIDESELDSKSFGIYAKVLRSVASHVHESKRLIKANLGALHFVTPCRMLNPCLLKELIHVSSRFVSNLPDLRDHLEAAVAGTGKDVRGDPVELTDRWIHRHDFMQKLIRGQSEEFPTIRRDLHLILSLAECGV